MFCRPSIKYRRLSIVRVSPMTGVHHPPFFAFCAFISTMCIAPAVVMMLSNTQYGKCHCEICQVPSLNPNRPKFKAAGPYVYMVVSTFVMDYKYLHKHLSYECEIFSSKMLRRLCDAHTAFAAASNTQYSDC